MYACLEWVLFVLLNPCDQTKYKQINNFVQDWSCMLKCMQLATESPSSVLHLNQISLKLKPWHVLIGFDWINHFGSVCTMTMFKFPAKLLFRTNIKPIKSLIFIGANTKISLHDWEEFNYAKLLLSRWGTADKGPVWDLIKTFHWNTHTHTLSYIQMPAHIHTHAHNQVRWTAQSLFSHKPLFSLHK